MTMFGSFEHFLGLSSLMYLEEFLDNFQRVQFLNFGTAQKHSHHYFPILNHVRNSRRCSTIILENSKIFFINSNNISTNYWTVNFL